MSHMAGIAGSGELLHSRSLRVGIFRIRNRLCGIVRGGGESDGVIGLLRFPVGENGVESSSHLGPFGARRCCVFRHDGRTQRSVGRVHGLHRGGVGGIVLGAQ